jgi:hypothetical protein
VINKSLNNKEATTYRRAKRGRALRPLTGGKYRRIDDKANHETVCVSSPSTPDGGEAKASTSE